ncbi:MAG: efflux RND transporter periplasmic adaptor subunit, partial [Opitutales bacterium]|nr:efflux RND transporter periplasmic adaptor subunit [Opitutales bacterium]
MAKNRKKQILQALTLSLALFCVCGCGKAKKSEPAARPAPVVYVERPEKRSVEIWDSFTARLAGEKSVEVRSRVSGYLEKICFSDGQFVKEGDILFVIDPRPFQAVVNQCKAKVKELEARIKLAENNLTRAEELVKSDAVSTETLETRRCDLLSAKAAELSAQAQLMEAELNLEFTVVKAPISGYVNRRYVDAGNLINASGTLLSTIVSRDVVYAYFTIGEHYILGYQKAGFFSKIGKGENKGPLARIRLLG